MLGQKKRVWKNRPFAQRTLCQIRASPPCRASRREPPEPAAECVQRFLVKSHAPPLRRAWSPARSCHWPYPPFPRRRFQGGKISPRIGICLLPLWEGPRHGWSGHQGPLANRCQGSLTQPKDRLLRADLCTFISPPACLWREGADIGFDERCYTTTYCTDSMLQLATYGYMDCIMTPHEVHHHHHKQHHHVIISIAIMTMAMIMTSMAI